MKQRIGAFQIILVLLLAAAPAGAAPGGFVAMIPVTSGLTNPVGVTNAGDGSGRLFIVQQTGQIRVWNGSALLSTSFLDISSLTSTCDPTNGCGERGLLGLAFHPNYESNGFFYVFYTRKADGTIVIARYHVSSNPNLADAASALTLLTIPHPRSNHNGGQLAFGPDGYLYIGTGDGGDGGDPDENGQNINSLLGKILRIDVNSDAFPGDAQRFYAIPAGNPFAAATAGADEVWAYGLRNPWKFSFDRMTGDLYIGDVGQNNWEEIDFQPAGVGGRNYGWDCREGKHDYSDPNGDRNSGCGSVTSIDPIFEYAHQPQEPGGWSGCSVTGGHVLRSLPGHRHYGKFLFADFCSGLIAATYFDFGGQGASLIGNTNFNISSFGEGETGRIYFTHLGGSLYWLAPHTFADVTPTHFAWPFVEAVYAAGVTAGCGSDNFCPGSTINRAEMAVFLLTAEHGPGYAPPPATGTVFNDVPSTSFAAAWIEQLAREGITTGCGGGNYCPGSPTTRDQMAVFLLLAREGPSYTPPACSGTFADVPCSSPFAPWVDELARRGITSGCGGGNYCPSSSVSRGQMAVFLATTFGMPTPP